MKLIDKSALAAEIEERIKECDKLADAAADNNLSNTQQANELLIRQYTSLLHFLGTLKVKEVDLKAEIERLIKSYSPIHTSEGKYKVEAYKEVLDIINSNSLQSHCSDCTNDKGCINCEGGNMHEVKKKEPEGALKELLDNIDPVEYDKVRREMKKETPNEEFERFVKAYWEKETDNIISFYDRYAGLVDGVRWQKVQMIGKAVQWLEENLAKETSVIGNGNVKINFRGAIKAFKKAMEE